MGTRLIFPRSPSPAPNAGRKTWRVPIFPAVQREMRNVPISAGQSTGLMRQIRPAYSRMLRSLENVPMLTVLSTAFRLQSSWAR